VRSEKTKTSLRDASKGQTSTQVPFVCKRGDHDSSDIPSGPRVSVGMPVHNAERYLGRMLGSLLRQSFDNFELVISDNAFYLLQGSENGDHDTSMPIHSRSLAARDC
jgi:hypothetical protein